MLVASVVRIYLAEKKYDLATSLCEARIKRNANDALAYDLLGQVYGVQKDYKRAEVALNKAAELQPNSLEPLRNLAQLYVVQGQADMAIKRMEERTKSAPDDINSRFMLAQLYNMTRKYPSAMDEYEKILQKFPDNWAAQNDLAFFFLFLVSENLGPVFKPPLSPHATAFPRSAEPLPFPRRGHHISWPWPDNPSPRSAFRL